MSSYDYSPSAVLVGEVDGLRVISSSTCDFLQKVPGMPIISPQSSRMTADIRLLARGLQSGLLPPGLRFV
jgi:hypothetical protein